MEIPLTVPHNKLVEEIESFLGTSKVHVSGAAKHEPCPSCRKKGNDTRGDNLGRWPDGHAWCFSCGYYEPPETERVMFATFKSSPAWRRDEYEYDDNFVMFPNDFSRYIPEHGMKWLNRYNITNREIIKHKFGWSQDRQRLIMPVMDKDNKVIMWQGRAFEGRAPKYLTRGPVSDICHIIYPDDWHFDKVADTGTLEVVIVEGLLDAIKVGRVVPAVPLWGSKASTSLLRKLANQFELLGVWLDPDKIADGVRTALRASQWIPSYVVSSTQDPKAYPDDMIVSMLDSAGKPERRVWKDNETIPESKNFK